MLPSRCHQSACRNRLVTMPSTGSEIQLPPRADVGQVRRDDAVDGQEVAQALVPALGQDHELPRRRRRSTAAISDSVTTGVRRVGFASRSGITDDRRAVSAGASSVGLGLGVAGALVGAGRGRGRRRLGRGLLEERAVQALARDPPHRRRRVRLGRRQHVEALEVGPLVVVAGELVLAEVLAVRLVERDDPVVGRVERVQRADPLARVAVGQDRRREHRVVAGRAELGVLGELRRPARRRDHALDLAVLGDEDVAVDHEVGHPVDRPVGGQASRPGAVVARTRRWTGRRP